MLQRLVALLPVAVVFGALAAPLDAEACSVVPTYIAPTNYELVDAAHAVLVGRVISDSPAEGETIGPFRDVIEFEVLVGLKGPFEDGDLFASAGTVNHVGDHAPVPLDRARSGGGMCNAHDFIIDRVYVLVAHQHPETGDWRISGPPFSRIAEVVESEHSPWARIAMHYAEISTLDDPAKERAALEALLADAEADPSAYPEGLAGDIERHFASPTYAKGFDELVALLESGTDARKALLALSGSDDPRARPHFLKLLDETEETTLRIVAEYFQEHATPDDFAAIAAAYERMGEHGQRTWEMMFALFAAARAEHVERMIALFEANDDAEEKDRFCDGYFARFPDARAATALAFALDEPGERTECLFALAATGSEDALEWAATTIRKGDAEDRWVALYLIARSPLDQADTFATQILEDGSDEDKESLIQGYAKAVHDRVDARLEQADAGLAPEHPARRWLDRVRKARAEAAK